MDIKELLKKPPFWIGVGGTLVVAAVIVGIVLAAQGGDEATEGVDEATETVEATGSVTLTDTVPSTETVESGDDSDEPADAGGGPIPKSPVGADSEPKPEPAPEPEPEGLSGVHSGVISDAYESGGTRYITATIGGSSDTYVVGPSATFMSYCAWGKPTGEYYAEAVDWAEFSGYWGAGESKWWIGYMDEEWYPPDPASQTWQITFADDVVTAIAF